RCKGDPLMGLCLSDAFSGLSGVAGPSRPIYLNRALTRAAGPTLICRIKMWPDEYGNTSRTRAPAQDDRGRVCNDHVGPCPYSADSRRVARRNSWDSSSPRGAESGKVLDG